jgi:hypothetical protein
MRTAIYVRVSTQRQAQTQTIEQQVERLKVHIVEQGWLLEAEQIYRDDGYSGAKLNRPGLDSLRDHAALAEFDLVLVTAPDRLARNYVHQVLIIEELEKKGVQVEFLDRPNRCNQQHVRKVCHSGSLPIAQPNQFYYSAQLLREPAVYELPGYICNLDECEYVLQMGWDQAANGGAMGERCARYGWKDLPVGQWQSG